MKNNFDPVAWCYDGLSWLVFGNTLKRSQLILLDQIKDGSKILIIGGGTGWMLHELLKLKTIDRIDYVEASAKMIRRTQKRIPLEHHAQLNFIHGQEDHVPQQEYYDYIIACYFFDLFTESRVRKIISILNDSLKHKGKLLVADFYVSPGSPWQHKMLMKGMYRFFGVLTNLESISLAPFRTILNEFFLNTFTSSLMNGFVRSETYSKEK